MLFPWGIDELNWNFPISVLWCHRSQALPFRRCCQRVEQNYPVIMHTEMPRGGEFENYYKEILHGAYFVTGQVCRISNITAFSRFMSWYFLFPRIILAVKRR